MTQQLTRRHRMKSLRTYHLAIAGVLFAIAILMYSAGLRFEAGAAFVLGAIIEVAAWIALLTDRSEGSFPGAKQ